MPLSAVLAVDIVVLSTVLRVAQDGSEVETESVCEIVTVLSYQSFVLVSTYQVGPQYISGSKSTSWLALACEFMT